MVVGLETGNDLDDEQVRRVCYAIQHLFLFLFINYYYDDDGDMNVCRVALLVMSSKCFTVACI